MKYVKKPVVIEAMQFTRENIDEVYDFTRGNAHNFITERRPGGKCACLIHTLEGDITASEFDYIIKGVRGEFYPCKPDIFMETYEKVETEVALWK